MFTNITCGNLKTFLIENLIKLTFNFFFIYIQDEKRCKYKGHPKNFTKIENTLLNRPDVGMSHRNNL